MSEVAIEASESSKRNEVARFPPIWDFIIVDCLGFFFLFVVFMISQVQHPDLFKVSASKLHVGLGLTNTIILLTGSLLVAKGNLSVQLGDMRNANRHFNYAISISSAFGLLKLYEYYDSATVGITPLTNEFFSLYFALTGIHFVHYLIGMVVLVAMSRLSRHHRNDLTVTVTAATIDAGAIYWHIVDVLWLFLFPMIYLVSGR